MKEKVKEVPEAQGDIKIKDDNFSNQVNQIISQLPDLSNRIHIENVEEKIPQIKRFGHDNNQNDNKDGGRLKLPLPVDNKDAIVHYKDCPFKGKQKEESKCDCPRGEVSAEIRLQFGAENKVKLPYHPHQHDDGTACGLLKDKLASRTVAQNNNIISQGEIQKQITNNLKIKKITAVKPADDCDLDEKLRYLQNKKGADR